MSAKVAVVTGGAGFIGSAVTDELLRRGWAVRVVDDLSTGRRENLPFTDGLHCVGGGDLSLTISHLTTPSGVSALKRLCDGATVVFHLAAQARVTESVRDPRTDAETNVLATIDVLEAARGSGARVVFASTGGAIYGECDHPADEHDTPRPSSPYAIGKLAAEGYVLGWNRIHGMKNVVLRYANVYGPRQRPDGEAGVVSIFANSLADGEMPTVYGDGFQTRDFVYVDDVARATVDAAEVGLRGVYNVGTGVETTIRDILDLVRVVTGTVTASANHTAPRKGDLHRSVISPVALRHELGWTPEVDLEDGIRAVHEWLDFERGRAVKRLMGYPA